jgi:hypothetical protein
MDNDAHETDDHWRVAELFNYFIRCLVDDCSESLGSWISLSFRHAVLCRSSKDRMDYSVEPNGSHISEEVEENLMSHTHTHAVM